LIEDPLKDLFEKYVNSCAISERKIKLLEQLVENLEKQNNDLKKFPWNIFLLGLSIGVFLMSIIITINKG
jgi:hypothetical protein